MAATSRPLTPSHATSFAPTAGPDTSTQPQLQLQLQSQSQSQSQSLAPIAAAATAAAQRLSGTPEGKLAFSPRIAPLPLTGAAALADERRAREEMALREGRGTSPNPAVAVLSALQGAQPTSPARMTDIQTAPSSTGRTLQIPLSRSTFGENVQTSPTSASTAGSIDVGSNSSTTAPTLATAMPTTADQSLPSPNTSSSYLRAAVDPGITESGSRPQDEGPRSFTFPPPPANLPEEYRGTPTRNMSLPNTGFGGSPRTGSGQRRHKCPYCATDFTRHHNLKSHLLTHSQEKPYGCETCNARFRRLHDLKRHQKLHTGERPHICNKCGRKFARGDALARHNKGQGGCAGRRSSFGVDGSGEAMDGVEYTAEPENMDDGELDTDGRRIDESISSIGRSDSLQSSRQPSTYPPLGPTYRANTSVAPMYPPSTASSHQNSGNSALPPYQSSGHSVFPQTGISESPKPISPGLTAGHANSRMSLSNLSHPSGAHNNQLPPITGMRGSASASGSSAGGSGASTRDFLGRNEAEVFNYARDLEGRLQQMQDEHKELQARIMQMEQQHHQTVSQLHQEIDALKSAAVTTLTASAAAAAADAKPQS